MSTQAWLVAIIYLICWVLIMLSATKGQKVTKGSIVMFALFLCYILLLVYDTDCLTAGECSIWSWIRTVLYVIFPVLFLIFYLYMMSASDSPALVAFGPLNQYVVSES
jgi:hypothetical protein